MFCVKFHAVMKWSQMHRNTVKWNETLVWGPTWWIGLVRCEKSRRDFAAPTFALIAPIHPIFHRVSCTYETIPNAPKRYEMHQNMSLGSNGVDQVCSLQKITTWLHGTNYCIIAPVQYVLHELSCTYETIPNEPKYYKMHRNIRLGSNGVDGVRSLRKITTRLRGTKICINCTISVCFATSFMQLRNDPKCTQIQRDAPKH